MIELRFKNNNVLHPYLRTRLSQDATNVVKDIMNNKYDERFMKLLDPHERELIKNFVNLCKYPVVLDKKESEDFNNEFQVLKGEILSGNDNPSIKNKLKKYLV